MATGIKEYGESIVMGSDFIYDHTCTRCYNTSESYNEAAYYCRECDVYYCKHCIQYGCGHGVLGRVDVKEWGKPVRKQSGVDCIEHPGNTVQMYCEDHEMVGCYVCMTVNHKPCINIKYIPQTPAGNNNTKTTKVDVRDNVDPKPQCIEKPSEMSPSQAKSQPLVSNVRVTGPGVEHGLLSNFVSKFKVETKGAGPGELNVQMRGPKGRFRVQLSRESIISRTINCLYNPTVCGLYVINVRWSGVDVPGSPFHVHLCKTREELERILTAESISQNRHTKLLLKMK